MAPMSRSALCRVLILLSGSALWWSAPPQSLAATLTVSPSGSSHFPSIQSALTAASTGDTVLLLPGVYLGSGNKDLSFLGKDLVLRSRDGASATIIDCQYNGRGVILQNGGTLASRIEGVTFRHGDPDGPGGGITLSHSAVTLKSVIFDSNRGSNNAGLDIGYSPVVLDSVRFVHNSATAKGGGIGMYLSTVEMRNCEFVENEAIWGGGIACVSSTLTIEDALVIGNTAVHEGGGMYVPNPSEVTVTRTEFRANVASSGDGGGLYVYNSTPFYQECIFVDNRAFYFGGGVYITGDLANVEFERTTFLNNSGLHPSSEGGALFLTQDARSSVTNCTFAGNSTLELDRGGTIEICWGSQLLMENSIIAYTTGGFALCSIAGAAATLTHCDLFGNLYGDTGCESASGIALNECLTLDPLLCDYPEGVVSLGEDSPCLPGNNAWGVVIGADSTVCSATGVEPHEGGFGARPSSQNYPNPFNPSTAIAFSLPEQSQVRLVVVDIAGRLVRTLSEGEVFTAGSHELDWNGLDDKGRRMSSGVYFYRLETDAGTATRQMVMLK